MAMAATNLNMMTDKEVAKALGVKVQTLRNMRCRGEGPAYAKIGRLVRYLAADVERYVQAHRVVPFGERTVTAEAAAQ